MHDVYEFLDDYEIEFGWVNKNAYGIIDPQQGVVVINIILMIAETFLHEFYHYKFPEASEAEVEGMARERVKNMTVPEIYDLATVVVAARRSNNA